MYMHKIEQTTTGAISVIRENSVKCRNFSDLTRYARPYLGSFIGSTAALLHASHIRRCHVRDIALMPMPTGRNAGHRKRQYVAALLTRAILLTITSKPDMVVVNPAGHVPAVRHSDTGQTSPLRTFFSRIFAKYFFNKNVFVHSNPLAICVSDLALEPCADAILSAAARRLIWVGGCGARRRADRV